MRRCPGFTLAEMLIVLVLSSTLIAAFYSFVSSQLLSSSEESSDVSIQSNMRVTLQEIVDEIEGSRLSCLDSNGVWVCYQKPLVGISGTIIRDVKGNLQYGAQPFDNSAWLPGGYYQIVFIDHTGPRDLLVEKSLTSVLSPSGQNISGTYASGATNFSVSYDKAFVFGHFEIQCHSAPINAAITPTGPTGAIVGPSRTLTGVVLRQIDPLDLNTPQRTWPWNGGFFYMRNTMALPTLNAAGTGPGTVWSPQMADTFTDTNNNGVWDPGEPFVDVNLNGVYDPPDCEPFVDSDGSCVKSSNESFTDKDLDKGWDAKLRVQVRGFEAQKLASNSPNQRDSNAVIRTLTMKVRIRNY